jgi:hypothetical protein
MIKKSYITKAIAGLIFIISYCFGYVLGTILVRFGMSKYYVDRYREREEIEEEIRRMNEQGPNN